MTTARRWRANASIAAIAATLALAASGCTGEGGAREPEARPAPPAIHPAAWRDDRLTIASLGHAALLMNYFGVRVISDPTLFARVGLALGPFGSIGPHRLAPPPLTPAQIGRVDVILVTHAHMDHLDLPSLSALPKSATVIACKRCAALIRPLGFSDVRELGWGDSTVADGLKITAMGARHWGRRWPPFGTVYGYNSYVLERAGVRMLLACDSAYTELFAALAANPPQIAAFSIGAYDPWIMNHADPEQVWEMFGQARARYLIPLHWGTFRLSKEPIDEPMRRLMEAAGKQSSHVILGSIGAAWTMPAASASALRPALAR